MSGVAGNVSVEFKEFGIRLNFTPTIAGDVIRLKVRPEVSTLDFVNGVTLSGFRIPALTTRRAETVAELGTASRSRSPACSTTSPRTTVRHPVPEQDPDHRDLFKSKSKRAEQTELMVLITPRLVRPLDPDEVPSLPTNQDDFIKNPVATAKPGDLGGHIQGGAGLVDAPPSHRSVSLWRSSEIADATP